MVHRFSYRVLNCRWEISRKYSLAASMSSEQTSVHTLSTSASKMFPESNSNWKRHPQRRSKLHVPTATSSRLLLFMIQNARRCLSWYFCTFSCCADPPQRTPSSGEKAHTNSVVSRWLGMVLLIFTWRRGTSGDHLGATGWPGQFGLHQVLAPPKYHQCFGERPQQAPPLQKHSDWNVLWGTGMPFCVHGEISLVSGEIVLVTALLLHGNLAIPCYGWDATKTSLRDVWQQAETVFIVDDAVESKEVSWWIQAQHNILSRNDGIWWDGILNLHIFSITV